MVDFAVGVLADTATVSVDDRAAINQKVAAVLSPYTVSTYATQAWSSGSNTVNNVTISLGDVAANCEWGIRVDWTLATLGQDKSLQVVQKILAVLTPYYAGATHVVLTTGVYVEGSRVFDHEYTI